jgi:hypothetical protein
LGPGISVTNFMCPTRASDGLQASTTVLTARLTGAEL